MYLRTSQVLLTLTLLDFILFHLYMGDTVLFCMLVVQFTALTSSHGPFTSALSLVPESSVFLPSLGQDL